ncbi:hypothetical protein CRG98_008029 [Punica granatum]|uniref:Mitochondrial dicarboxylate/tricarboxylate transporter DTC-like n=1 Tax=Punica granatum TaxID=22663 RepID=A0A2I0KSQ9_PUNGR|nr:hypothetical protein CRG98_008029 [Punica granatum]
MGEEKKAGGVWPTVKPFVNGGASGMLATCVIQPIDMVKVRIQLGQGSAGQVTKTMLKEEGVGAFYKGLSAGLLRQATYTTARLGSFRMLTAKAIEANDGKPLPLYQKALCGLTAGAIGASVGSPADLALIRMQADATLPAAQRRNYTNAFHALYRIVADEGVLALWKGAGPTVVRAMALNMGMLASYDQSVEFCKDSLGFGEAATVIGASTVSGFFAAACSLPFDYVKTQIQKMQPDAQGNRAYSLHFAHFDIQEISVNMSPFLGLNSQMVGRYKVCCISGHVGYPRAKAVLRTAAILDPVVVNYGFSSIYCIDSQTRTLPANS